MIFTIIFVEHQIKYSQYCIYYSYIYVNNDIHVNKSMIMLRISSGFYVHFCKSYLFCLYVALIIMGIWDMNGFLCIWNRPVCNHVITSVFV